MVALASLESFNSREWEAEGNINGCLHRTSNCYYVGMIDIKKRRSGIGSRIRW
jgi:hypothetical protein